MKHWLVAAFVLFACPAYADTCDAVWGAEMSKSGPVGTHFANAQLAKAKCQEEQKLKAQSPSEYNEQKKLELLERQTKAMEDQASASKAASEWKPTPTPVRTPIHCDTEKHGSTLTTTCY